MDVTTCRQQVSSRFALTPRWITDVREISDAREISDDRGKTVRFPWTYRAISPPSNCPCLQTGVLDESLPMESPRSSLGIDSDRSSGCLHFVDRVRAAVEKAVFMDSARYPEGVRS